MNNKFKNDKKNKLTVDKVKELRLILLNIKIKN